MVDGTRAPSDTEFLAREGTDEEIADHAFERVSSELLERIERYGNEVDVAEGEVLYLAGRDAPLMLLVLEGLIEIVGYRAGQAEGRAVVRYHPGDVVGELALITGQPSIVTARAPRAGRVRRLNPSDFARLMREETGLADILLSMFVARRQLLRTGVVSTTVEIIGSSQEHTSLALRTYAERHSIPYSWLEADSAEATTRLREEGLGVTDLPVVMSPKGTFPRTTPGELGQALGLTYPSHADDPDLVVVGAGPAGMAAAVYGASEGLRTTVLDAKGVGGQAAASSRIENYLGFPSGISGAELLERSALQAEKFGARIYAPCIVSRLSVEETGPVLHLEDGTRLSPRAIIVGTGARYRSLPLDRWDDFERTSIYYAATDLEVRACGGDAVVVGGANSAGQAALHLADAGNTVTLVSRSALAAKMSQYLVDRLVAHPSVRVIERAQIKALQGGDSLTHVEITTDDGAETVECTGLFCFTGAQPVSAWLPASIQVDESGFVLTDVRVDTAAAEVAHAWRVADRQPLPFETSVPRIFAVGDVRRGSMKRVAAAVGEGASAVHSVHSAVAISQSR
jgi:thioredoxin reductase (NADPH)